jgi:ABC-type multidrug transport system fused ATPase/permease subunit
MVIVAGILSPIIRLMIQGGITLVIIILLLIINPTVAISAGLILGGAYLLIYQLRKKLLSRLGEEKMLAGKRRVRTLEELLQGIKTVKTYGNESHFTDRYHHDMNTLVRVNPRISLINKTPRFILELIAYCGIISVTLILYMQAGELGEILPTLTLFAVAGYRLLPALQEFYSALVTMRSNAVVLDGLYPDLKACLIEAESEEVLQKELPFHQQIVTDSIGFHFPRMDTPLFEALTLIIPQGQVTAFVGKTGSGKTTLVDMLTGLLQPTSGNILIDGRPLDGSTIRAWRKQLAYVPQAIFLYDSSLRDNITFGHLEDVTDEDIMAVLELVELASFVREELPDGLSTTLGENGIRLSGGQRQRIGLARALLRKPALLVLDEATSALDNVTENSIIEGLNKLPESLTILIIAHRLSTVRHADQIHLLDSGNILASGTYEELVETNDHFRRMTELG